VLAGLGPVQAPPTLGRGPALRVHLRFWPVRQWPVFSWWNSLPVACCSLLFAGAGSGFWRTFPLSAVLVMYFFPVTRESAQALDSYHFFSEISRLGCASDLGWGINRLPYRPVHCFHSTPRASGFSAANIAHSSTFSFPGTPLWAGHHLISIVTFSGVVIRLAAVSKALEGSSLCVVSPLVVATSTHHSC